MKKLLVLVLFALALSVEAFAHQPFTLVSSEKKTVTHTQLASLETKQTVGKKDKTTLTFTEKDIRLVVITGPEDDMLSYRIQGVRNPTLAVPAGARMTILFVNVDVDMRHDLRFGHIAGKFVDDPETAETAGTAK